MRALCMLPFVIGAAAGCAKSGLGEGVRTDVVARMESTRPTVTECYARALKENRKLRGTIVLQFAAAASTGKFTDIQVVRDDVGDAALQKCVVDAVEGLALATPQKTTLSISYPLDFQPIK